MRLKNQQIGVLSSSSILENSEESYKSVASKGIIMDRRRKKYVMNVCSPPRRDHSLGFHVLISTKLPGAFRAVPGLSF